MTCETCALGRSHWFDMDCPACMARHYTLVLGPTQAMNDEARRRALDTQYRQKERLRARYSAEWMARFEDAISSVRQTTGADSE